ncbi:TetR/AcrR family transcriptional regulator [Oceanobacillus jeddahense]|uniref:TetR/AcrR family transcriptional regulator n=1 Tax=Oceanobacillus jeddahense TaxID=1462527 RepID=A0ABY5JLB1_9BACI|nr:TetR/AcrR family transcriptional regulator [Oceanobacillus jeddahense]UUI01068.1 TetR/AcrR family transcriptional regulator [Oceanobacillus jeddahense]
MPKIIDHTERKDQIVEAAFDVIYHNGFEKTNLRKIAKKAGLSLGSVQHFFPKQKDMYTFAMDVIFQRFKERMQKVVQADQDDFENAVRMVKQIVQVHTEEERIENDIWVKFTLMATMNPEYQELKEEYRKINLNFAEDIIRLLYKREYITNSYNIKNMAHSLIIFVTGLVFEAVIYTNLYNDQVVEKQVREYLRNICN